MKPWTLVKRSLTHYWRLNLAVLAGVLLTSAILSGSLVVGDSVKESLRQNAAARISGIRQILSGGDRFFTTQLADSVREGLDGGAVVAPVLQVRGTVSTQGGGNRANNVQIIGVTDDFWKLSRAGDDPGLPKNGNWFAVNDVLASRLNVKPDDRVIVRVEIPGTLSRDAPLSGEADQTVPLTESIDLVVGPDRQGRYSLRAEQVPPPSVYLPISVLQEALKKPGEANLLLTGGGGESPVTDEKLGEVIEQNWRLEDAALALTKAESSGPGGARWDLTSSRVFIDQDLAHAADSLKVPHDAVLTYLVNGIRKDGGNVLTPYSMVTGTSTSTSDLIPKDLKDGEIVITQWLADDQGLKPGDKLTLEYYVVEGGRTLTEETASFTVRAVLPMDQPGLDKSWTPNFPGLLEVEDVDRWEPGIPIDNSRIRDKDEAYWDDYRATPKAFVTLATARKLWTNRFGDTTAFRYATADEGAIRSGLKEKLTYGDLGLTLRNLESEAASAVAQSYDFGELFAYMSFFLIVAALILTGLVFVFGVEQRRSQIGLLMAVGMPARKIRGLFLKEAILLSGVGALLGLVGGFIYTKLALWGMSGAWKEAAAGVKFVYFVKPVSLIGSWAGTVAVALFVVYLASRAVSRVHPSQLIAGGLGQAKSPAEGKPFLKTFAFWIGVLCLLAGVGCLLAPKAPGTMAEQAMFFMSGFCITGAGVAFCLMLLRAMEKGQGGIHSLAALGRQNSVRRKGRSLAVIGLMAAGVFMVTAINAFRMDARRGNETRDSGTGGFAYVGETTLPVYEDLNSKEGREKRSLPEMEGVDYHFVQFRVSNGEDASCLNLNRAQRPRLLAVKPEELASREAFSFGGTLKGLEYEKSPWELLKAKLPDSPEGRPVIPGMVDQTTAAYALKLGLGDTLPYEDGNGNTFDVKLVGLVGVSLLQGSIVIDEANFTERFPDAGGYRYFLLDVKPRDKGEELAQNLSRLLGDYGLELMPTWQRLNEFNAVQNTYLSIFSTLGGLGLLLGTVGLAIVVGRNVLERQGQLGLMQAVGFTRQSLSRMVVSEHWFLHVLGVVIGVVAAIVGVMPKIMAGTGELPLGLLGGLNLGVLAGGLIFCWLAARQVTRMPLIEALRTE